jgi:hypothetical protein
MARLLLTIGLAAALLAPAPAGAAASRVHGPHISSATYHHASAGRAAAHKPIRPSSTDPVALALQLAEQYWRAVPACGTPRIVTRPHQLPNSDYETVTSPEPTNSVVEMWTEVQKCTITINASIWGSWHEDDESFQWFCDSMTHEVGHLFGQLDGGQTNPSSITYPFLSGSSPNFNSVPECRNVTLRYGQQELRNEEVIRRR